MLQTSSSNGLTSSWSFLPQLPAPRLQEHRRLCSPERFRQQDSRWQSEWWWWGWSLSCCPLRSKALRAGKPRLLKGKPATCSGTNRHDLQVFPFSDWRFPSLAGYTGNTDTVYGVSGVRFLRTMEVVPAGTCSYLGKFKRSTVIWILTDTILCRQAHHLFSAASSRNKEDFVEADGAVSGLPVHSQGGHGGVGHPQVLHSSQWPCTGRQLVMLV